MYKKLNHKGIKCNLPYFLIAFPRSIVECYVYIVYMGRRRHDKPELVEDSHHEMLSGILGSKAAARGSILCSYNHGFSGFAAILEPFQAAPIADHPGVVRVIPHKILRLNTTRSWELGPSPSAVTYE
ncbi:unnamed protein product [Coffea canephora]|uniref:DH200=94 genomic scaffold, scaffold_1908 n=1 Tax=Coffea canephora TaxID=49390 RepID=A0A068VMG2_COFCA|nr:unnamed protein product [Coffea canephora]